MRNGECHPLAARCPGGVKAAGVLVGTLAGLGISDEDLSYFDQEFRRGRTIVVVETQDRVDVAYDILRRNNSFERQITSRSAASSSATYPHV